MTITDAIPVSFENFVKLPRGAQFFVAYCLLNDAFDLQLLMNDQDMQALVEYGWLVPSKSTTHGIYDCSFPDSTLLKLEEFESKILSSITEEEMDRYKSRKGKEYPWLW